MDTLGASVDARIATSGHCAGMTSPRFALGLVLVALFGCSYTVDEEHPRTRLMENDGACPGEDAVATAEGGEEADRTAWRRIELTPLCYYRARRIALTGFACGDDVSATLYDVRMEARKAYAPTVSDEKGRSWGRFDCTVDGMVFVTPADGATCPAPEDAFYADAPGSPRGIAEELLASDRRTYRHCAYDVTFEVTRRPFSCGGGPRGVFAP